MMTRCLVALLLSLVVAGLVESGAQAAGWKAGAASQKITPETLMWMAGYGSRNHAATGLLNDLHAKALVLEDEQGTRVAFVTLDLVGISPDVADPITAELTTRYQLPRANVVLCCSHTHSGPAVGHNLRTLHFDQVDAEQQKLIEAYAMRLKQEVIDVVGRAIAALTPSQVSFGQGTVTFAANRRNNKEPDVPKLREAGQLVGPFDHDVPVLKVAGPDGALRAVLFGYACHATVLDGYNWSSDYPGFAQSALEEKHPGCVALFWAGCGADQNPLPRRKVELASKYGADLAAAVDAVLSTTLEPISGEIKTAWTQIPLSLAHVPSREEIDNDAQSSDRYLSTRAKLYQRQLEAGQKVADSYSYPIQAWRIGSKLLFVSLGGEVVVDYALRIKQEFGASTTWVAGYSNDVMAYIPSRRVLTEGGYEGGGAMVYYALPSPWAPSVEQDIIDALRREVAALK